MYSGKLSQRFSETNSFEFAAILSDFQKLEQDLQARNSENQNPEGISPQRSWSKRRLTESSQLGGQFNGVCVCNFLNSNNILAS
jgi:hypothetical protein